jgi:hypothetical protein
MWFLLGFVTLIGSAALIGMHRWEERWSGTEFKGARFKIRKKDGDPIALRVGTTTACALDFEVKTEGWLDRLAKRIGLSVEPQLGQPAFDERLYLVADDERLVVALRQDVHLLRLLERIGWAAQHRFVFKRLVCRRGQLWIDFAPSGTDPSPMEVVTWAAPVLESLAARLPEAPPGVERGVSRQFLRAVILLALSSALAVNGIGQAFRMSLGEAFTVDAAKLAWPAAVIATGVVLLLAGATLALLMRSARTHLVLVEVLLVGGLGAFATTYVELRDLNMEGDASAAAMLDTQVLDKYTTRGRRGSVHHHLELVDWNDANRRRSIGVGRDEYATAQKGDRVVVSQHPGYLGARWVESVELKGPPDP